MTQWTDGDRGRQRGLVGLAAAWIGVLTSPRAFFEDGVAPGDQGPGLTFLVAVVVFAQGTRFALGTDAYPVVDGRPVASGLFWLLVVAVLLAPLALHLVAAVQTVLLAVGTTERGGVSETVQVLAYASAPCVLTGVPVPAVQLALGALAAGLYLYGLAVVHGLSLWRAGALGLLPAIAAYGYGFRTLTALSDVAVVPV